MMVFSIYSFAAVTVQGNHVKISESGISLSQVIKQIEKQVSAEFVYKSEDLKSYRKLEINEEGSVTEVLKAVLQNTDLQLQVSGDVYLISKKTQVVNTANSNKQEKIKLKGTVTDENGEPIPFASVCFKGTSHGCVAALDGVFELEMKEDVSAMLVVSCIGFESVEIPIGNKRIFKIVLKSATEGLEEVVVTGMQTIKKGRATGSFSILNEKELDKIYSTDFVSKLEGSTPGVLVDGDDNIIIRGINTFSGNRKPLIVIDGIPTEMETSDINPKDIKQISVLKDAASASIWGVRSSNGVIVITTNRGAKDSKPVIRYSATFTVEDKMDLSDYKYLNSSEFVDMEWEQYTLNFNNDFLKPKSAVGYIYQDYLNAGTTDPSQESVLYNEAVAKLQSYKEYNNEKDIEKYFYQNAITQQHNLSVSVGGKNVSNYFSLNFDENKGALVRDVSDRINMLNNLDVSITDKLNLSSSIKAIYKKDLQNGVNPSLRPYESIKNEDGSYALYSNVLHRDRYDGYQAIGLLDWTYNPLRMQRDNDNKIVRRAVSTSLGLSYELFKGVKLETNLAYEYSNTNSDRFYSNDHYQARNVFNELAHVEHDGNNVPTNLVKWNAGNKGGVLNRNIRNSQSLIFRNKLSFNKSFNDIRINALVGTEHNRYYWENQRQTFFGYNEETFGLANLDMKALANGQLTGYEGSAIGVGTYIKYRPELTEYVEKYISFFGTASITYKDKYDIFASARLDKTNLLVDASKFRNNPTWSVGGKWHLSREEFFRSKLVDNLSIKVSYGLSGLMAKDVTPNITAERFRSYFYPDLTTVTIKNPENKNLGWEKTKTFNLGVNMNLIKRVSINVDLYNKKTTDVLSTVSLDPTSGWKNVKLNAANISNKGIDLSLNYRILDNKLKWDFGLNYSYNKNEITNVEIQPTLLNLLLGAPVLGESVNAAWSIRYGGLDEKGDPTILKPGSSERLSYNELSSLKLEDYVFDGSFTPSSYGSFSSNVSYKAWSLGVLFTYKLGHKVRMPYEGTTEFDGPNHRWIGEKYRWIEGADNSGKTVPRMIAGNAETSNRIYAYSLSDYMLEDGDIVRLKSIKLTYNLNKLLTNTFIKDASLTLSGQNLWFWAANRYNLDSDRIMNEHATSVYNGSYRKKFVATLNLSF
jgi:TonB-linked SusC/RagA family outer membrane protein